jgi:hypothetical protein
MTWVPRGVPLLAAAWACSNVERSLDLYPPSEGQTGGVSASAGGQSGGAGGQAAGRGGGGGGTGGGAGAGGTSTSGGGAGGGGGTGGGAGAGGTGTGGGGAGAGGTGTGGGAGAGTGGRGGAAGSTSSGGCATRADCKSVVHPACINGRCVDCETTEDCSDNQGRPYCNTATHICRQCTMDAECTNGQSCNQEGECEAP